MDVPQDLGVPYVDAAGDYYTIGIGGGGLAIGSKTQAPAVTPIKGISVITASLTPVSVAAAIAAEQGFTVGQGLVTTDVILLVGYPTPATAAVPTGIVVVRSTGNIFITYVNPTAGALVPTAGTYTFLVFRK